MPSQYTPEAMTLFNALVQAKLPVQAEFAIEREGEFTRRNQIKTYLADLLIGKLLICEIEGKGSSSKNNRERDEFLKSKGYIVLHISNALVNHEAGVLIDKKFVDTLPKKDEDVVANHLSYLRQIEFYCYMVQKKHGITIKEAFILFFDAKTLETFWHKVTLRKPEHIESDLFTRLEQLVNDVPTNNKDCQYCNYFILCDYKENLEMVKKNEAQA